GDEAASASVFLLVSFFFSSRRRHTRFSRDWSSDVCSSDLESGRPFAGASRETLLLVNNLLLVAATAMVLLGTLYPLLADALGMGKISVGPPCFGLLFIILMTPLVILVRFVPLTPCQRQARPKPLPPQAQ